MANNLRSNYNLEYADGGGSSTPQTGGIIGGAAIGGTGQVTGKTGGNKGGTGSSKPSTPSNPTGTNTGFDVNAYYAQLAAEAQARADAAYQRNMERIASAYGSAASSLKGNYDSTVGRLNAAKDKSMGDVNKDAERSLREAYVNSYLEKKNLNQRLAAMGYNGGAAESTMADLANEYGNSRTGINRTLNSNISDLNQTYSDNLASALQSYNSAKANLDLQRMQMEMQAENARQNAIESSMSANFGIDSSYMSALQAALQSQGDYTYNASMATNSYNPGTVQQAQSAEDASNYAKFLAQGQLEASQGQNPATIRTNLINAYNNGQLNISTLYDVLKKLGMA